MAAEVRFHRAATVLLAAALLATLTVALTGGDRAGAVEGPVEVVYVATGQNFPDALAGANLAATVGAPMLTVNPDLPIPDATIAALDALDPNQIIILGGPVAVSDAVRDALASFARSGAVARIEGSDRHDTAAKIADALPPKVHNADLLDGLDASDFLRTDASLDADTLDGLDATDYARASQLPTAETVIEHISCSGNGFFPTRSSTTYLSISNTGRFVTGTDARMNCVVSPPDGSRLVGATFVITDVSTTASIDYVRLMRYDLDGLGPKIIAQKTSVTDDASTPGRPTVPISVDPTLPEATVDTGTSLYELQVRLDASASTSDYVAIHGASVSYEIDRIVD